jgi:uncharacterized protein (DUF2141 family)
LGKIREKVGVIKLIYLLFFAATMSNTDKGILEINISGIKRTSGNIKIALWKDGIGYPDNESLIYRDKVLNVNSKEVTHIFENLEEGEYALTIFHDLNNNGKLDKNVFGYPTEPFAFSNNVKPVFGIPPYNNAKFKVLAKKVSIQNIKLL